MYSCLPLLPPSTLIPPLSVDILLGAVEPLWHPVLHHRILDHRVEQRVLSRSLQSVLIRVLEASMPLLPRSRTRRRCRRKDMQAILLSTFSPSLDSDLISQH
jgi:hypothetical protein